MTWLAVAVLFPLPTSRAQQCANDTFELLEADSRVGFGRGVATAGDVDGDGEEDFFVVSSCDGACTEGALIQLISGADGQELERYTADLELDTYPLSPMAALGDIDDDGFDDYAVATGSNVRVISGQSRTTLRTLRSSSVPSIYSLSDFGLVISSAGDMNGDGEVDIAVAAPKMDYTRGIPAVDAGAVFVFSGANGGLISVLSEFRAGHGFGSWAAPAGDLDEDGRDDLIILARQTEFREGAARVVSGRTLGTILGFAGTPREVVAVPDLNDDETIDFLVGYPDTSTGGRVAVISGADGTTIQFWDGRDAGAGFGHSVAIARDLDFDGLSELIVGAPFDDAGGLDAGRVLLISGGRGTTIAEFYGTAGDLLGVSVAAARNLLSKERPAVLAGRPGDDDEGGGVQAFFIAEDLDDDDANDLCDACTDRDGDGFGDPGFVASTCDLDNCPTIYNPEQQDSDGDGVGDICECSTATWTFDGPAGFGRTVAGGGDVDNDGHHDIAVGAESRVTVFSGADGTKIHEITGPSTSFGRGVAIIEDVNGDGHDDVAIGEPENPSLATGVVWIYSGDTGTPLFSPVPGITASVELGHEVAAAGDVNRDGAGDLIAGVDGGGVVYVISGVTGTILWDIFDVGAGFGNSVAGTGDVNDDGYDDYAVAGDTKIVVYSGETNFPLHTLTFAAGGPGTTVAAAGDVNRDGFFDFMVGLPDSDAGGADAGEAFVISGDDGSTLYHFTGAAAGDQLGIRVSGVGDTNSDGFDDFVLGQREVDGPEVSIRSLVYSGKSGALWYTFAGGSASTSDARNVGLGGDLRDSDSASLVVGNDDDRTVKVYSFDDRDDDSIVDACDECPDIYNLRLGVPATVDLVPGERERPFKIEPDPGAVLTIDLRDENAAARNVFYARWSDPATRRLFDLAADRDFSSSQRLVVPFTRAEVLHLLARATRIDGSRNRVTILVEQLDFALTSLSLERVGASGAGVQDATVLGGGFDESTLFELVHQGTGERIPGLRAVIVNADRATTVFDTAAATPGTFDLEATKGETTRALDGVFEKTASALGAVLDARLSGPEVYRDGRTARLTLTYANLGDAQMLAPIFKVVGPPQARLGLERGELGGNELLVIGAPPNASAGTLPAGARGSLPIIFESPQCQGCLLPEFSDENCVDCKQVFTLEVFEPSESDFIAWEQLGPPRGISARDWRTIWPRLSVAEGIETWLDYHEALSRAATRLASRGGDATSLVEVFRLLLREARGLPDAAIVGRLRDSKTLAPIGGARVQAFEGGLKVDATDCAVTDANGGFALENLRSGTMYEIAAAELSISGDPTFTLPPDGDLTGVELVATKAGARITRCPEEERTAGEPLEMPASLFRPAGSWRLLTIAAWDPNDKDGPIGPDDLDELNAIPPGALIEYNIYFENKEEASAAAERVEIQDFLDPKLDWTTFEFKTLQIGSQIFEVASEFPEPLCSGLLDGDIFNAQGGGVSESSFDVVLSDLELLQLDGDSETTVCVDIDFTLDLETGEAFWTLEGTPVDAAAVAGGLLPPNETPPEGEGKISFTVEAKKDLDDGDQIENEALILFDGVPPGEETGPWINTISYFLAAPASDPLPADGDTAPTDTPFFWHADGAAVEYTLSLWKAEDPSNVLQVSGDIFEGAGLFQPAEPLEASTDYRWRVDLTNSLDVVTEGPVWAFSTSPPPGSCPPAASAPTPAPGATIDGENAALSWNGQDAEAFRVFVAPSADLAPGTEELGEVYQIVGGITESEFDIPEPLQVGVEYTWQVVSVTSGCPEGVPGPLWTFETGLTDGGFRRCDVNDDGTHDIADAVAMLFLLFLGEGDDSCPDAVDCDDDGDLAINDPVSLLNALFLDGAKPPEPYANCGEDPSDDEIDCSGRACEA